MKKDNTRRMILDRAYALFARRGFNAVTMKDVCEATGLSRGGLYAHFSGTAELFEAVLAGLGDSSAIGCMTPAEAGVPARELFLGGLRQLEEEMNAAEDSLSLAMYEYAEGPGRGRLAGFADSGRRVWADIIRCGVERGEFNPVDPEEIAGLLMFAYQGVRMWSRIITVTPEQVTQILNNIKRQVLKDGKEG